MDLLKQLMHKQTYSSQSLLCAVCGKRVKGACPMAQGDAGIYMGPNGVVVRDFAAGTRALCHNKCMGKGIPIFQGEVHRKE
jgi:hypothetical protein